MSVWRTHLLSVDPGEHSGWVLWQCLAAQVWAMVRRGRVEDADAVDIMAVLAELQDGVGDWRGQELVIEGQYIGPNEQAAIRLIERRCAWVDAAEIAGIQCDPPVNPSSWIAAMTRGCPGRTSTERIEEACRRRWPSLDLTGDVAAAALLGAWWIERHGGVACAPSGEDES